MGRWRAGGAVVCRPGGRADRNVVLPADDDPPAGGGGLGGGFGAGAAGGSGVVILKVPDTHTATFSGGVTSSLSTSVSGFNIYTVTATSTTSETVTFNLA